MLADESQELYDATKKWQELREKIRNQGAKRVQPAEIFAIINTHGFTAKEEIVHFANQHCEEEIRVFIHNNVRKLDMWIEDAQVINDATDEKNMRHLGWLYFYRAPLLDVEV